MQTIAVDASGFCECSGGRKVEQHKCNEPGRKEFTCKQACGAGAAAGAAPPAASAPSQTVSVDVAASGGGGGGCVSWRQTGGCTAKGPREPTKDHSCEDFVDSDASGYCECAGGRRIEMPGCAHDAVQCKTECARPPPPPPADRAMPFRNSLIPRRLIMTYRFNLLAPPVLRP